jgi:hypothetical protein
VVPASPSMKITAFMELSYHGQAAVLGGPQYLTQET